MCCVKPWLKTRQRPEAENVDDLVIADLAARPVAATRPTRTAMAAVGGGGLEAAPMPQGQPASVTSRGMLSVLVI